MAMERELLALAAKYEADDDPIDVLESLATQARLLAATERLRRLMRKDAAAAGGGADGLFELKQRTEDGAAELVGEGGRMARRLRVRQHEDVRLLDGTTTITARVALLPQPPPQQQQQKPGKKQQQAKRPRSGDEGQEGGVQLHFRFTRRPGPRRGSSMPYPADEEEGLEDGSCGSSSSHSEGQEEEGAAAGCPDEHCCGGGGDDDGGPGHGHHGHAHGHADPAPTTIVEYRISASPSLATPPVEVLHVVIYGLDPSGTPSPGGIRGAEDGERGEGDGDGDGGKKDLGLVEVDGGALQAALRWCCGAKPAWGEPEFLNFLMFFPYWEEEFDVPGLVYDQVFGEEDYGSEEGEEEGEAPSVKLRPTTPSPGTAKGQGKGKKGTREGPQSGSDRKAKRARQ